MLNENLKTGVNGEKSGLRENLGANVPGSKTFYYQKLKKIVGEKNKNECEKKIIKKQ